MNVAQPFQAFDRDALGWRMPGVAQNQQLLLEEQTSGDHFQVLSVGGKFRITWPRSVA